MKKNVLSALALCLTLCVLLCSCSLGSGGNGDVEQGNAPVTGETKEDISSATAAEKIESTAPAEPSSTAPPSNGVTGRPDSAAKTFTGYSPLPKITLTPTDPNNTRGLSTATVGYSYGVSKNAVPHDNSLNAQKYFTQKKFNAVSIDTVTQSKVLYLTFDCGWENGYTTKVLDVLKEKGVPSAFFCTLSNIRSEPELTARMIKEGHIVGNHSDSHPDFSKINRTQMAKEIETCDNYLREHFGYSSPYFRFPMGSYSESALDLVTAMGFKSVFWSVAYADWDVSDVRGKQYAFDTVTSRLHPGAVILLHSVSPDNAAALGDIIDWARAQGYEFRSLAELPA